MLSGEAPADLEHRATEDRVGGVQSDEPGELGYAGHFDSPEPKTLLLHTRDDAVEGRIGFLTRSDGGEVLHHLGVGVQRREWHAVARAPGT